MAQIEPGEKNAIVAALLNLCVLGGGGYYYLGQSKKGLWAIIVTVVFLFMGWIPALVFAYDAYLLGQKLANGEAVRENECGLGFLSGIFGIFGAKDE